MNDHEQTIEDLKFNNYKKEMFLDSDTKIALISSAPSDIEQDWFLTNQQMADARKKVNDEAGSRRLFCHCIFTPGQPGWLEKLDAGLALKPESCKGYTIGDNTHKEISRYPWRMDDEKVTYKGYEKMVKAGIKNVCVHKGLFPPGVEKAVSQSARLCRRRRRRPGGQGLAAAQLRHLSLGLSPCRRRSEAGAGRVRTHRADFLDQRSRRHPGAIRRQQRLWRRRAIVRHHAGGGAECLRRADGHLIKGLGVDRVCWGTDALWTGAPQWQIEGLRRLEIPEAMQKKFGFAPLGAADGPVKTAIFGDNNARLYNIQPKRAMLELKGDRFAMMKAEYEKAGPEPSNTRYGYVVPNGPIDHSVFV